MMAERLPDLQIFAEIYADEILIDWIGDAYKDVICFAKEALKYFEGAAICKPAL